MNWILWGLIALAVYFLVRAIWGSRQLAREETAKMRVWLTDVRERQATEAAGWMPDGANEEWMH